jgi:hypothetical protein
VDLAPPATVEQLAAELRVVREELDQARQGAQQQGAAAGELRRQHDDAVDRLVSFTARMEWYGFCEGVALSCIP